MKSKTRKATCLYCKIAFEIDPTLLQMSPTKDYKCPGCGKWIIPQLEQAKKGNDNQKRSKQQEKRAAKRYDASVQPASGALSGAKGDIKRKGVLRGECKFTRNASFSLKLSELLKLQKEAVGNEMPLFEVEFQGVYPTQRFVILRADDFVAMKNDSSAMQTLRNMGMAK